MNKEKLAGRAVVVILPLALAIMSYSIFTACTKAAEVLPVDVPLLSGEAGTNGAECAVIDLRGEDVTGTLDLPTCAKVTIGDVPTAAPSIDPTETRTVSTATASPVPESTVSSTETPDAASGREQAASPTAIPTPAATALPSDQRPTPRPLNMEYDWTEIDGQSVYVGCPGGLDKWRSQGFEGCTCQVQNSDNSIGTGLCVDMFPAD